MKKNVLASSIAAAIVFCSTSGVYAADDEVFALEEIVVTARKIAENMQDVPVAVNSMTAEDIKALNLSTAQDVLAFTPGAEFSSGSPEKSGLSIRGISSGGPGASVDTGVLVMSDGEVLSRSFMQTSKTFDVSRVEVLRGPQGTTYGRNATAGVVNFISNRPTDEFDAGVSIDVGNYDLISTEGFVSGQISDGVLGRLSGAYEERDGYYEDASTGKTLDDEQSYAVRGQLQFNLEDDLTILVAGHISNVENEHPLPRKPAYPDEAFEIFGGAVYSYTDPKPDDAWKVENSESGYELDIWGGSVEVQKDFDQFSVYSLTTYRNGENKARVDLFGTPEDIVIENSANKAETWSQELRLDNANTAERFGWQVGLYYLHEEHERTERKDLLIDQFFGVPLDTTQSLKAENETDSIGVFTEMTYDITDDTSFLVGARYSNDKKQYDFYHLATGALGDSFVDPAYVGIPIVAQPDDTWEAVSGKVSLTHRFSESVMAYVSWASGYKSGGFNAEAATPLAANQSFEEETVETIEVGAKMDLFDDRVRLNAALFDSSYEDIHGDFFTASGGNITSNVGEATIKGVEIEALALITQNLRVQLVWADYKHEYDTFDGGAGGGLSAAEVEGQPVQGTPDWTGAASIIYDVPLDDGAMITLRAGYRGRGDVSTSFDADPNYTRRGVESYNAQIGYLSADEKWGLTLWGRNLNNEEENTFYSPPLAGFSQGMTSVRAPRTFGVTLDYTL